MIDDTVKGQANRLAEEGKTPLYFAKDDTLLGMIAVADTMKEDSADAVSMDSALPSVLCFFMLFTLLFPLTVYNIRMFSNIYV